MADIDACWDIENTAEWEQKTKGHVQWLHKQKTVISSTGSTIIWNIGVGYIVCNSWMPKAAIFFHGASHELHSLTETNTYKFMQATISHTNKLMFFCIHDQALLCLQGHGHNESHYHKAEVEWCCSTHACPPHWGIPEKKDYIMLKASPPLYLDISCKIPAKPSFIMVNEGFMR